MLYIQVDVTLIDHPKTKKLARLLGVSRIAAVGHLVALWSWAAQYASDGDLTAYREEPEVLADGAQWEGDAALFVNALINAKVGERSGFLEDGLDGSLWLHDWSEYFGKLIERRQADAERKRAEREAERLWMSQTAPDTVRGTSVGHPQDTPRKSTVNVAQRSVAQTSETRENGASAAATPAPVLPEPVRVFEANGGTYQSGKLADGTLKRDRARQFIAEHIRDDPTSLALWGQVVAGYCAQWSSKSYTIMVNDYYLSGRIPGQRSNGNGKSGTNRTYGLASLRTALDDEYDADNTPDKLAAAQADWDRWEAERQRAGNVP